MKEFSRLNELFIGTYTHYHGLDTGIRVTQKYASKIQNQALQWFKENLGAKEIDIDKPVDSITYDYTCGELTVGSKKLPHYHYRHIIIMAHLQYYNDINWQKGFEAALERRNENPFSEANFYAHEAWDYGYAMGQHNFKFTI